jgi:dihydroorotase
MVKLPAFADLHVHFREPGQTWKETIRSGSRAAARGGYTLVCTMPNLDPVPDSLEHLAVEQEAIDRDASSGYSPMAPSRRGGADSSWWISTPSKAVVSPSPMTEAASRARR